MKLFLMGKQSTDKENPLNKALISEIKKGKGRIAYIPSSSEKSIEYYKEISEFYKELGYGDILYFDLAAQYNPALITKLLNSDVIYLSGENTYKFLLLLRKRKLTEALKEFAKRNGIIVGVGGGSILLTQDISLSSLIYENSYEALQTRGFSLTKFEVLPHWQENKVLLPKLIDYTINTDKNIFAFNDGYGVSLLGDKVEFYGDIINIKNGSVSVYKGNYKVF